MSILKKTTTFKNIPQVLKSNAHSCSETFTKLFSDAMNNGKFLDELELGEVTPTFKKDDAAKSKHTIDLSVFYQQFQTCLNANCTGRMPFLKKNYLLICVGTVKVLVHNKPIFFD